MSLRAAVLALLVLALPARAQITSAEEQELRTGYKVLGELLAMFDQKMGRPDQVAKKAELIALAVGRDATGPVNYALRRLLVLKVAEHARLREALLFDESEIKPLVPLLTKQGSPDAYANLDELFDGWTLRGAKVVTGGSIRAPPPPVVAPPPSNPDAFHVANPGPLVLGGIFAALLVGGVAMMLVGKRTPEPEPEPMTLEDAPAARAPSSKRARTSAGGAGIKVMPPPAPAAEAVPPPVAQQKPGAAVKVVIDTSAAASPMGRTQDMVFDQTRVIAPGEKPAPAPVKPAAAPPPAAPPAAAKPRQPTLDVSMETSKMNRTLPPYQPKGVAIKRPKKPAQAPSAPPDVPANTLPDRYTVLSILGKGGMGVVYKAYDEKSKREVAVKTLSAEVMATATSRERFVREYETLNALSHPNIIKVYDMGCISVPYFAMEYCDGDDLGTIMLDAELPQEVVLEIGIQLSNALEYAHTEGIYHRDIKPSNLMITTDGSLKIVDFGLVKDTQASKLTMDGTVLGSLRFMAPEQLAATEIDQRCDVYSIGMTLYYLLSGATPFDGHNPVVKLGQEPSSVGLHAPQADKRLVFAIDRCIRKDAKNRWQSAREVEDALRAISL